ncbi:hypothetical protein [Bifidobacterium thermophilum]|uniref:hypothetical protein n=1 Tax=Bifidobacterium thermophilum TaxID=33905 RepID=UPI0030ADA832
MVVARHRDTSPRYQAAVPPIGAVRLRIADLVTPAGRTRNQIQRNQIQRNQIG